MLVSAVGILKTRDAYSNPVVAKNRASLTSFRHSSDSWATLRIYESNHYNVFRKDA